MFNRIPTVVLVALVTLSSLGAWPAPSAAECLLVVTARPLPVTEQAARVRAELVAAALADLKANRLVRELHQARVASSNGKMAHKRIVLSER